MHRFFVEKDQISDKTIIILNNDVKHIRDVLRLRVQDKIEIICDGHLYEVKIIQIKKSQVTTEIIKATKGRNEPKTHIRLFQGLAKSNKMETIFQKGTEIGIKEFYPLITKRTVVKIEDKKKEKNKRNRWATIIEEASKQAKRDEIPKLMDILTFNDMIRLLSNEENIIVAYEDEDTKSIKDSLNEMKGRKISIIVGPEGGFDSEEVEELKYIGAHIVSLGNRILRTETAGLVCAAVTLYEKDDLGVV